MLSFCFQTSGHHGGNTWDPNYAPGMDFLDHIFFNLKNSSQDLSNEESLPFFDKLIKISSLLKALQYAWTSQYMDRT